MSTKHTPGPWQHYRGRVFESDERGATVANVVTGNDADERLIAAAPELLALAQQYASECGDCNGSGREVTLTPDGEYGPDVGCESCADIRAVIAKAVQS